MEQQIFTQGFLFPEPEGPATSFGAPVVVSAAECAAELSRKLLAKREGRKPSLVDQLFRFMVLRGEPTDEKGDILTTHVGGFHPDDLPAFTNNACKTLGDIFELVVTTVYSSAYPGLYSKDFAELTKKVTSIRSKLVKQGSLGKWRPDFLIEFIANEIKYRAGNGQGSTEQADGAKTLLASGYVAVMLFLRISPNANKYQNAGWYCRQAEETIERIESETGVNIIEVMEIVGRDPKIVTRRTLLRKQMMAREAGKIRYRLDVYGAEMLETSRTELENMRNSINALLA
jgi:hypothetical protein